MGKLRTIDFGPRASALPGPQDGPLLKFLYGRQGGPRTIKTSSGVGFLNRNTVVRWYPHNPDIVHRLPEDTEGILDLILKVGVHHSILQGESEGTVRVPSYRSFVAENPIFPGTLAVVSTVERCEGVRVNYSASKRYNGMDPRNAKSLYACARYLARVLRDGHEMFLIDNLRPDQFLYGIKGAPNPHVDIDPILDPLEGQPLQRGIDSLIRWAGEPQYGSPYLASAALIINDLASSTRT